MTSRVTHHSTLSSAADALRAEEVKNTRELLRVGWMVAAATMLALQIVPGDPRLARALLATLGVGMAGSLWMYLLLRDPAKYAPAKMSVLAIAAVVAGQLGILYVGVLSAAPMIIALGLYFFCRTENRAIAIAIYVAAAGMHALEAGLVITGVIEDPGFYPIGSKASQQGHIVGHLILQMGYALCFWLARVTRKTSLKSIEQLQKATRLAAQRDVQLAELRQDLDRALKVGGPGRFTGVVAGSWELGNILGRGAMGEVYEAKSLSGQTEGAVKLLRRELMADPRSVERFFREVRVASSINSPHVVRVLESSHTGDALRQADVLPFLAMERLRGQTLGDLLRRGRGLNDVALGEMVEQVCEVLELAREAGIVHRDLKPQNLFLTYDNVWKVLDFGVAVLADSSGTLTRGSVIGTPAYMAPEQAKGEHVDHRADVYAFGAVIYRCVTGRAPFAARDTPALLYSVVHEMPQRPSSLAQMPQQLDHVLLLAIAKNRDLRIATAGELLAAFRAATAGALPDDLLRRARELARTQPWREADRKIGSDPIS